MRQPVIVFMSLVFMSIVLLGAPITGWAEEERQADHDALRALLKTTQEAINTQNFDTLAPHLAPEHFVVTTVDGQKLETPAAFKEYWNKLFKSKGSVLEKIDVNAIADGPTEFPAENVGVCHGTSTDTYHFKGGATRTMPVRWTAVMLKEGNDWKLSKLAFSANILDNPVLDGIQEGAEKLIALAAVLGLLVGIVLMVIIGRSKKPAA